MLTIEIKQSVGQGYCAICMRTPAKTEKYVLINSNSHGKSIICRTCAKTLCRFFDVSGTQILSL